ncbi:BA14K family protein [Xanthobacteraceae bacterium A53D]
MILGSAIGAAAQPVYVAPQSSNWIAYCSRKYRSFDPRTGTFLGYDGRRHPCR